jgi:signal transduction histidine kinase
LNRSANNWWTPIRMTGTSTIVVTLVTAHGGRLWAERRAERGAAFYVALPLAKRDA